MYLFAYLKIMMMDTKEKHKTNKNRMITESSSEMDTTKLSIKMFLRKLIPDYNKMNIIVTYIQKKKTKISFTNIPVNIWRMRMKYICKM